MSMVGPIKIGYSLSLSGPLGPNGQTAYLAHRIWEEDVNKKGGLLGRPVKLVCVDDKSDAALVPAIYEKLLDVEKVDLVLGGYGNNSISPAMPLVIERQRFFVGLMGLGVNGRFDYAGYFAMIPTGPDPNTALTAGFFEVAGRQKPKPQTVAILAADADFSRNPITGAHANAEKNGLRIISETKYPLTTKDFAPLLREVGKASPDILFLCSYLNDSIGLIRGINEVGLEPKMVGGAMIGPQSSAVQAQLGPLLNGLVNYEYWFPVPKLMVPGVEDLIRRYQARAGSENADALGYYVAPMAYAQMQVVEQAVSSTKSLDDRALIDYTHTASFTTAIGDVKFGKSGEWSAARVLAVQFRNIRSNDISEFKDARTRVVLSPDTVASGELIYPYVEAKKAR
jgi:branched-chain amino acid transport system substrate-binding protein